MMSTSCGVPASWLSNVILNGASAGAVMLVLSNFTCTATSEISPGAPGGGPDGAGDDPPSPAPLAERGGNQPRLSATDARTRTAMRDSITFGQPGAGSLARCPVRSAS